MQKCKKNHKLYWIGESCPCSLASSSIKPELSEFKFDAKGPDFLQMFAEIISYVAPKMDVDELKAVKKKMNKIDCIFNLQKNVHNLSIYIELGKPALLSYAPIP
jgi:hypothetical protein